MITIAHIWVYLTMKEGYKFKNEKNLNLLKINFHMDDIVRTKQKMNNTQTPKHCEPN